MAKPMFIESDYRPGDKVQYGPHEANIQAINVSSAGMTYTVSYWSDTGDQLMGSAFAWELQMIDPIEIK